MNNLSEIISIEKKLEETNKDLKPLLDTKEKFEDMHSKLIALFLEKTMVKRKKYYLDESNRLKWVCWTTIYRGDKRYYEDNLFHCEFRSKAKNSIIFKECLNPKELYELFTNTHYYKELVRETSIENIIGC